MSYPPGNPQEPWQVNAPLPPNRKPRAVWPLLTVGAALVVGVIVVVAVLLTRDDSGISPSDLENIRNSCGVSSTYATVGDSGRTLTVEGRGEEDSGGLSWSEVECVLSGVKMPASVRGKLGSTRALDGMQSASWGDYSATWNYHPNSGINLIITTAR